MSLDIRMWRGTPLGRRALQAFPGRRVRELATLIEDKPGFKNQAAREAFPGEIRRWAFYWLHQIEPSPRRNMRLPKQYSPKEVRNELQRLMKIHAAAVDLQMQLMRLPDVAVNALAPHLRPGPGSATSPYLEGLPEDARRWAEGREALAAIRAEVNATAFSLRRLARAAELAVAEVQPMVQPRRPERKLKPAVHDLARIWIAATGQLPGMTWNEYETRWTGRFTEFVRGAVHALWPNAGSLDGLIREACTEVKEHAAR